MSETEFHSSPLTRFDWLVALGIAVFAALLRLPGLESLPPALWFDEGLNGVDALAIARGGPWHIVFPDVFPREPLLIYPMALLVRMFGPETFSLRLASALVGTAAPPLLFLWLRRASSFKVALFAAIFLATFRWHLHFSRIALRTIWTPTLGVAYFVALWTALGGRQNKVWAFIAGMALGLGVYAYLSWYFFIPGALLVAVVALRRANEKTWLRSGVVLLAGFVVVASPMWLHYLASPADATGRVGALSLFDEGTGPAFKALGRNGRDAALMLVWKGDHVPKHNIPWRPALEPIGAILFLVGLGAVLTSLRRSTLSLALLAWLILGTLPTVFSRTDSANFLRTLIVTPAVAAIVGIGGGAVSAWISRRARIRKLADLIPAIMVGASAAMMLGLYFVVWSGLPGLKANFSGEADDIARFVRTVDDGTPVYVPSALARDSYTFRFLTAEKRNVCPYSGGLAEGGSLPLPPFVVIESPYIDPQVENDLQRMQARLELKKAFEVEDSEGRTFVWARALFAPGTR